MKRGAGKRPPVVSQARVARWLRPALTISLLALLGIFYLFSGGFREAVDRAAGVLASGDIRAVRDYMLSYGAWAPVISASLMVLQALLAFLPSFLIAFANGLAFGFFWGAVLSVASAALAAGICFGISRALGRTPIETLVGKKNLGSADRWFARYGAYAILVARLVPVISFDAVSYAAGLTRMSFGKFLLATTAGMLPATLVYTYLGERAPQYVEALLLASGIVLGTMVVVAGVRRHRSRKKSRVN